MLPECCIVQFDWKYASCFFTQTGNIIEISNNSPILLLTTFSKFIEKLLLKRLVDYLQKYNMLSHQQYGFREERSTEDVLLNLTTAIYRAVQQKITAPCDFVEMAKFFDIVSHKEC